MLSPEKKIVVAETFDVVKIRRGHAENARARSISDGRSRVDPPQRKFLLSTLLSRCDVRLACSMPLCPVAKKHTNSFRIEHA